MHGVQATGGEKSWQFSRPDTEIQRLRAGDGRVFVSTTAGGDEYDPARRVYALDSETGTGLWDRAGSARVYTDATLYGADPDGGIQAVDVETGDRRWLSRKPARGTLVVADTTMYRVESDGRLLTRRDTADVPEDRATVHAIDTATMTARWERRDVSYTIRPTVADDTLFLSTAGQLSPQFRDLEIIGLDTATGERTWGWPVPGGYATTVPGDYATTSPIVVDGTMYIGTSSGSLYAVETDTDGSSRDSATLHGVRGHHGGWVHGDGR